MITDLKIEYNPRKDTVDLIVYQGDNASFSIILDDPQIDLQTEVFVGKIKDDFNSTEEWDLSVTKNVNEGKLIVTIPSDISKQIPTSQVWIAKFKDITEDLITYYYDIQAVNAKKTIIAGRIYFNPEITK